MDKGERCCAHSPNKSRRKGAGNVAVNNNEASRARIGASSDNCYLLLNPAMARVKKDDTTTASEKPGSSARVTTVPPAAAARSRSPVRPRVISETSY